MSSEAFDRLDVLLQVGLRLARSAPTGRILLARVAARIDPAWIPRPRGDALASELRAARTAACEPLAAREVERALRDAWGGPPTDELDDLDPEPAAVTPTSQVHRATLDGAAIAVKVLRPGIEASVRQDLALLEGLVAPLAAAFPALDAGAVLRELRERVLDELDLEHEAQTQRWFHRGLRGHPFLTVPAPVTRLASDGVLVSEWIEGVPLWRVPDPDQAAARMVLFVLGAARAGIVHADPDPDDVLVLPDGRLAILDFGATRAVDAERVGTAATGLEAFAEGDPDELGSALDELGWLPASHAPLALEVLRHALGELAGTEPERLDVDAVRAAGGRLLQRPDELVELILAGALPPEDLWPARAVAQLFGTIARVGATGAWRELTRAALRDGWSAAVASCEG